MRAGAVMKNSNANRIERASTGKHLGPALGLALVLLTFICQDAFAQQPAQQAKTPKRTQAAKKQTPATPPVQMIIEPKAIEILKASCDRLASARSMRFTAVVTYESPSRLGPALAYTTRSEVTLQRPDKLRVITPADGPATAFYYDGKTMTAFAPAENLIAVSDAPPTIDGALKAAFETADIYYPFTDLIVADPYKALADGMITAFYIGQSTVVGDTTTDMVAYADSDVFIQAWIGVEDKLPRMVRAVYLSDRARLRHQLEISNLQFNIVLPDGSFSPVGAEDAMPIEFSRPITAPPAPGAAPAKPKPAKGKAR
jgi:hypothetical protein